MSVDLDAVPITHPAEKQALLDQALLDLLPRLEKDADIVPVTQEDTDSARAAVAEGMGW